MKRLIFTSILLLFLPVLTRAESISLTVNDSIVEVGDSFSLTLSTKTDGRVNTIDGKIRIPKGATLAGMTTEGSPIEFWTISPMEATGDTVRFTGISTAGFSGERELFTLLFRTVNSGPLVFQANSLALFAHDGLGTKIPFIDAEVRVEGIPANLETPPVTPVIPDAEPPSVTTEIVTDRSGEKPVSYLLIYGRDKETAIRSYELIDHSRIIPIETPYLLDRGLFTEKTDVVVTDLAFNKTRMTLYIPGRIELFGVHPTLLQALLMLALVALGTFTLIHILEMHPKAKSRVWPWT